MTMFGPTEIVADASTLLAALLGAGPSRQLVGTASIHAPAHVDVEVAGVIRREVLRGRVSVTAGATLLDRHAQLGLRRHAIPALLPRMWTLRDNVTAADAAYVALAERLGCPLVTGDARLAVAVGPECEITLVRS